MRTAVFAATLSLLAGNVLADPEPWMEKENPDELALLIGVDEDCSVTEDAVRDMANGVLIRSRIKPLDWARVLEPFGLRVSIDCTPDSVVFMILVDFIDQLPIPDHSGLFDIRFARTGYTSFGTTSGDAEYILNAAKRNVERAITDYLKANFDL